MRIRGHVSQLLIAAAAIMMTCIALAAPAGAAIPSAGAPPQSTSTAVPSHTFVSVSSGTTAEPNNAAGNSCRSDFFSWNLTQAPFGWPVLAWYKMTTYYCWNGVIVTSHSTREDGGVTASGSAAGWTYNGNVNGSVGWNCYIAYGSTRQCSGNTEYAQGSFQDCLIKFGCVDNWYPQIQEWENYHGQFLHN
jgi:hypothetical protein